MQTQLGVEENGGKRVQGRKPRAWLLPTSKPAGFRALALPTEAQQHLYFAMGKATGIAQGWRKWWAFYTGHPPRGVVRVSGTGGGAR